MTTTIQIKIKTLRRLKKAKEELKVKTYDDVLEKLLEERAGQPKSLFGSCPWMEPFTEKNRLDLDEEKL